MEEFRDSCYAFCVSEYFNNTVMWGNYANSNMGICLGYESEYRYNTHSLEIEKEITHSLFMMIVRYIQF
jgi:hypothetical protein